MTYDVADGLEWYLQLLMVGIAIYIMIVIVFFVFAFYNIGKSEIMSRILRISNRLLGRRVFPDS